MRSRTCNSPAPAHGGAECAGSPTETKDCGHRRCGMFSPADGRCGMVSLVDVEYLYLGADVPVEVRRRDV